ncbi:MULTISPECIES: Crp/Fnr family transcriptional regulator [Myroides]|uniref:Cyclic nucleotide-binding domain-containing protein n=1 Tax=Myroides albus TaxID=2562892 RepID=A0A6I3LKM2_9FLAO|nr:MULTISPECIES: Crp/Fnr family transcriptional regulator [Myroides]MTG98873.1 cyclic nucleotide-binding domain-containing protein [Myroides albus]MVX37112.1 cyclic nucleotide-binding domain-containing protein [Myroides sp. LoEW2-1]UVD79568.1 Crp/Fnr family transcriptional regulator [Myroides albus]
MKNLITYLQNSVEFTDEELDKVLSYFHYEKYEKGVQLTNSGTNSHKLYFVSKGCVRIFYINEAGQDATRYIAFENQFATALVNFIDNSSSYEYLQTLEVTEAYWITHNDFYNLLESMPKWEKFYRKYLELAYLNNTARHFEMVTMDASERYKRLLSQNPIIVRRLPNKIVATYLNVSQETLSRIKSKVLI